MAVNLTLYGRGYCHLCEIMWEALIPLREEFGFTLVSFDVDSDEAVEERLGELVPVLMHGNVEICHYHLDADALRAYLGKLR
jgi:hypothetical protein